MITPLYPTYNRTDIAFEKGEGVYLYGTNGRRYLDFASGIAVTALGHCHPHLVASLTAQANKYWHCSNIFTIPEQQRLAERMVAATFADTVFFGNSGSEAVECAIKTARKYWHHKGQAQKQRIICANNAFHGRTLATIFAAGQEKLVTGFGPTVPGFDHVAFGNLNEMRAAVTEETAAIMVEPIQGEGGYRPAPDGYLRGLRAICDEFDLLLIYDEVQCGNGRSGKLFAHEWEDVPPDILATAKGMGGGFPVGACLATEEAASGMTAGTHGSTYGGNPLAMAVGNAVLDILLSDGFLDQVQSVARYFAEKLAGLVDKHRSIFVEARGLGLLQGLKCADNVPNTTMVQALRDAGLLTVGAGDNVVRMAPPLIMDNSHVDEAIILIDKVATELAQQKDANHG